MAIRVRDFSDSVPRDFGLKFREAVLDTCLTVALLADSDHKRSIDESRREATFVITTPSQDSYDEIIDAGAFEKSIRGYLANPVLLPEHRHIVEAPYMASVGACQSIVPQDKILLGMFRFDEDPLADIRWRKLLAGSWRAVSVGFRPVRTNRDADGILHYTEAILKEVSTCMVPANDHTLLVNTYVAGQFEQLAKVSADARKIQELTAAVQELRADMESGLGVMPPAGSRGMRREEHELTVTDDCAQQIVQTCSDVAVQCRWPDAA